MKSGANAYQRGTILFAAFSTLASVVTGANLQIALKATTGIQSARFQPPFLDADGSLHITLEGVSGKNHRIDFSSDLMTWRPVSILNSTSGPTFFEEPLDGRAARYYRAVEVQPGLVVFRVVPGSAPTGSDVVIDGQFFKAGKPGQHRVTFGGVDAVVKEATATRLTVRIPNEAQSGRVRVTTPDGAAGSPAPFIVLTLVATRIEPPGGGNSNNYGVANMLGGQTNSQVLVRLDMPLLTMAALPDETNFAVLYAVSVNASDPLVLNAASTAEALVFLNPAFMTSDGFIATRTLEAIHGDTNVIALVGVIERLYPRGGDPLAAPEFQPAYSNAIASVAASARMRSLAASLTEDARPSHAPAHIAGVAKSLAVEASARVINLDLEYLEISAFDSDHKPLPPRQRLVQGSVGPRPPYFNSVDWLALVRAIDVEKAFPRGRPDFDAAWLERQNLKRYPLKPGLTNPPILITAELITERLNPIKFGFKSLAGKVEEITKALLGEQAASDNRVDFPDPDGIYLMRGVGPNFYPGGEYDFVRANYPDEQRDALAANVTSVILDLIGVVIDGGEAIELKTFRKELAAKIALEALKHPALRNRGEFRTLVTELFKFALGELVNKVTELGLKGGAAAVGKKGLGTLATSTLKFFDILGGSGQALQRETGIISSSPLESAFIIVGDPFRLEVLAVDPAAAGPGKEIAIRFKGPPTMARFSPASGDMVNFEGPHVFDGVFIAATGPDGDGVQAVMVRIPDNLPASAFGNFELFVNASGRRGEGVFRLDSQPFVRAVTPTQGFAPSSDFLGAPFGGDTVRLSGGNFGVGDRFFFSGSGADVQATLKIPNASDGDVTLTIPSGARSGSIRVEHRLPSGDIQATNSPFFTVLGPPAILGIGPTHGPEGTTVAFDLINGGPSSTTVAVTFSGVPLTRGALLGNTLLVSLPSGAKSGEVTVTTPAGKATTSFTVDPGLTSGGLIEVGGPSIISLGRAAQLASRPDANTNDIDDDCDVKTVGTNVLTGERFYVSLDPPFEEGDFVTDLGHPDCNPPVSPRYPVGRAFHDSISIASGTNIGDADITMNDDSIVGGPFKGNLTIRGNYNRIVITIEGTLIILGDHNYIRSCKFDHASSHGLVIRGNHNFVESGDFRDNGGDGLRIEGGKFNTVSIARSTANAGNGVTLTGGAHGNTLAIGTGLAIREGSIEIVPGSGNHRHGLALLGSASNNVISVTSENIGGFAITGTVSGNDFDGIHLDGAGVTHNSFSPLICDVNGRNGVTVTNGASANEFGFASFGGGFGLGAGYIFCDKNGGSGVAIYGASDNKVAVNSAANAAYGVLLSGVTGPAGSTEVVAFTGFGNRHPGGNTKAGVRLENGTTAVRLEAHLKGDRVGLEVVGGNVAGNLLQYVEVNDSLSHGIAMTNAGYNNLVVTVRRAGGSGLVLSGAQGNSVRIFGLDFNTGAGVVLTDGAVENRFTRAGFPHITGIITGNRQGLLLENGSRRNRFEDLRLLGNRAVGMLLRGNGTDANHMVRSEILFSGAEGVLVIDGASHNRIGGENNPNPVSPYSLLIGANVGPGVRLSDAGTTGNLIQLCNLDPRSVTPGPQASAIVIENGASFTTISSNNFLPARNAIVVSNDARQVRIVGNKLENFRLSAVLITNATDVTIGGPDAADGNTFTNQPVGIEISGARTARVLVQNNRFDRNTTEAISLRAGAHESQIRDNLILNNGTGILLDNARSNHISGNTIMGQVLAGVQIQAGASDNELANNLISTNAVGVVIDGVTTVRNHVVQNSITANAGAGIRLRTGANSGRVPPTLSEFFGVMLFGEALTPDGSSVEVFRDSDDEGKAFLGTAIVTRGRFRFPLSLDPLEVGRLFKVNATVTDPLGNTSEFSGSFQRDKTPLTTFAWTSTRDGNPGIYLLAPPEAVPLRLTVDAAYDTQPKLSPDGTKLLFVSTRDGNREVYVMEARAGATPQRLTSDTAADFDPAWSPGGEKIAFASERGGSPAVYVMNANGSGVTRLLAAGVTAESPVWLPDGSKLALVVKTAGRAQIAVVNADGTGLFNLSDNSADDTQPAWSADGTTLAFVSDRDGNREIYSMRANGSQVLRLTNDIAIEQDPAWLPGGHELIFSSNRSGNFELYIQNVGGSPARRFSVSSGDNTQPTVASGSRFGVKL